MLNIFKTNIWNKIRYTFWIPVYNITVSVLGGARKRSLELTRISADEKILIIGCGSGLDLDYLTHCKSITATDITPAMIAKTRKHALSLGLDIRAEVMDGQNLDLPDSHFDVVILHMILAVIPDPYKCIREAARVLKPGGRIAVLDKFLGKQKSGLLRKFVNLFSIVLFTDINRRIEDIALSANLKIVHDEPVLLKNFFRIIQLRKER